MLGAAGVLAGRRATTHWEDLEEFAARFPEAQVVADRYVIDGRIVTAGGASPAFDLVLHLVRSRFGAAVALDVASVFVYDEAHAASDAQPLVSLGRLGAREPRVAAAIRLMEASLDRPLASAAIARRVGVSVRSLETLFRRALGVGPAAYGMQLRLAGGAQDGDRHRPAARRDRPPHRLRLALVLRAQLPPPPRPARRHAAARGAGRRERGGR